MSKENSVGDSLGAFVGRQQLQEAQRNIAQIVEEEAQNAWRAENKRIHAIVESEVEKLDFPGIVQEAQGVLEGSPRFRVIQMALRTLSWIPDVSKETRDADEPRIRAVQGHAFLLGSHGTNGKFPDGGEQADNTFYALGVAVEKDDESQLYTMTAPDIAQDRPELYDILTEGVYASRSHKFPPMLNPNRWRSDSIPRQSEEIEETLTESTRVERTQAVTRLLLDHPPIKQPILRKIGNLVGYKVETPIPTYAQHLQSSRGVDPVNNQELESRFNAFLQGNSIINPDIRSDKKR